MSLRPRDCYSVGPTDPKCRTSPMRTYGNARWKTELSPLKGKSTRTTTPPASLSRSSVTPAGSRSNSPPPSYVSLAAKRPRTESAEVLKRHSPRPRIGPFIPSADPQRSSVTSLPQAPIVVEQAPIVEWGRLQRALDALDGGLDVMLGNLQQLSSGRRRVAGGWQTAGANPRDV